MNTDKPDLDTVAADMVARYQAHKVTYTSSGHTRIRECHASCSCGWDSGLTSDDLRPQWAAVDKHMIDAVVPAWPREVCWCGRVILRTPFGAWTHAADEFIPHDARPPESR